jgi:hypothetical protein
MCYTERSIRDAAIVCSFAGTTPILWGSCFTVVGRISAELFIRCEDPGSNTTVGEILRSKCCWLTTGQKSSGRNPVALKRMDQ